MSTSTNREKLSSYQVTAVVATSIIGVIVLTLPRLATELVQVDGGFATLLAGLISLAFLFVIAVLCRRFPQMTVIEFSKVIFGKYLGFLYGLIFTMYSILVSGVVLRTFADALKLLLLPRTPLEFILITMLLVSLYLTQYGIGAISKVSEIFLPLIIFPIALLLLLNFNDVELIQLRPMFSKGLTPFIKAVPNLFLAYLGYEVLFMITPFVRTPQKILKYAAVGVGIPVVLYTTLVMTAITIFGVKPTGTLVYPTVILARRIIFPGAFAERFDIFFIIFWILAAYTTIVIFHYLGAISFTRLIGLRHYKPFIFIIAPLIYLISILPQNILQIDLLAQIAGFIGAGVVAASIPMLIIAMLRKKGRNANA